MIRIFSIVEKKGADGILFTSKLSFVKKLYWNPTTQRKSCTCIKVQLNSYNKDVYLLGMTECLWLFLTRNYIYKYKADCSWRLASAVPGNVAYTYNLIHIVDRNNVICIALLFDSNSFVCWWLISVNPDVCGVQFLLFLSVVSFGTHCLLVLNVCWYLILFHSISVGTYSLLAQSVGIQYPLAPSLLAQFPWHSMSVGNYLLMLDASWHWLSLGTDSQMEMILRTR